MCVIDSEIRVTVLEHAANLCMLTQYIRIIQLIVLTIHSINPFGPTVGVTQ